MTDTCLLLLLKFGDCGLSHVCAIQSCSGVSRAKKARHDELAKVASLRSRLPYISQSALGALLRIAKSEKLPDVATRDAIRDSRDQHVSLDTPYGKVHQLIDIGGGVSTEVQHPLAMLHTVCAQSESFSSLIARTFDKFPCSPARPWQLIIYTDEVAPGNQLAYKHARKTWAWYWSVVQFEQSLSNEDTHTHTQTRT